jgi:hypothetical protein
MPRIWLIIALASLATHGRAAEDADAFDRARSRTGLWLGAGLARAQLHLNTTSAKITTQVAALPTLTVGADWWPRPNTGLFAQLAVGTGAELDIPSHSTSIQYNAHQFELGARYRWFLGPRSDALAPYLGLGLRGTAQTAQVQRPSLLTDATVIGPSLHTGVEWPVLGERLWLRAQAWLGLPFFIRESPDDSGDPESFFAFGARLGLVAGLTPAWAVQLSADLHEQRLRFVGEGTRAATVFDAETRERWFTGLLALRYAL